MCHCGRHLASVYQIWSLRVTSETATYLSTAYCIGFYSFNLIIILNINSLYPSQSLKKISSILMFYIIIYNYTIFPGSCLYVYTCIYTTIPFFLDYVSHIQILDISYFKHSALSPLLENCITGIALNIFALSPGTPRFCCFGVIRSFDALQIRKYIFWKALCVEMHNFCVNTIPDQYKLLDQQKIVNKAVYYISPHKLLQMTGNRCQL